MTKTLISVEDPDNSQYLIERLKQNYLLDVIDNENSSRIDVMYECEVPDLVLLELNNTNLMQQIKHILQYDTTACIVALIDEDHEDLIPFAYKAGVRSVLKYYPKLDHEKSEYLIDEINRIGHIVQRNGKCLLCWRETKFVDKYHEQKTVDLVQVPQ